MRHSCILIYILFGFILLAWPTQGAAETYSQKALGALAEAHLAQVLADQEGRVELHAIGLDTRLADKYCPAELAFSLTSQQLPKRQATVEISCPDGEHAWRLYMPVRIDHFMTVAVATQNLNAGHILTEDDIALAEMNTQQIRENVYTDQSRLIGTKAKRRIAANQPIRASQTCFVCRGDDVTIRSEIANLSIEAKGVARSDGHLGEKIRVKNARSQKDLRGVITDLGEVTLN